MQKKILKKSVWLMGMLFFVVVLFGVPMVPSFEGNAVSLETNSINAQVYTNDPNCNNECAEGAICKPLGNAQDRHNRQYICQQPTDYGFGDLFVDISSFLLLPLFLIFFSFSALLLNLSGILFDGVVEISIVQMAEVIEKMNTINTGWELFRDIVIMALIFILLRIAIQTTLGMGGDTRKLLANVVIVGVFINFSLPMTKVIIDASNVLAFEFYKPIRVEWQRDSSLNPFDFLKNPPGISGVFMNRSLLNTLFTTEDDGFDPDKMGVSMIMGGIFMLILAFTFLTISGFLLIRLVVFIFLLVTSAAAFLSLVVGQNQATSAWWKALWAEVFFAPAFMALLLVVKLLLESDAFKPEGPLSTVIDGEPSSFAVALTTGEGSIVIFNFFVVVAFLLGALTISRQLSSNGSAKLTAKVDAGANAVRGFVKRRTYDRARLGVRGVASVGAKRLQDSDNVLARGARRIPFVVEGLGNLEGLGKKDIDETKGKYQNLSTNALKSLASGFGKTGLAGTLGTNATERAAISQILAERKGGLTPDKGRGYTSDKIIAAQQTLENRGADRKKQQESFYQYANKEDPKELEAAIQGFNVDDDGNRSTYTKDGLEFKGKLPVDDIAELDKERQTAFAPGTGNDENRKVRDALYRTMKQGHVEKLLERDDGAATNFFANIKADFKAAEAKRNANSEKAKADYQVTITDLSKWLTDSQNGYKNSGLASWMRSQYGKDVAETFDIVNDTREKDKNPANDNKNEESETPLLVDQYGNRVA